jgi:uncharacterized protein involved in exopolysaccharide biosynthesis
MNTSLTSPGPRQAPAPREPHLPALPGVAPVFAGGARLESLDLDTIWSALWRQKIPIVLSTLLVGILAWLAAGMLTPKYEARAYLRIDGDGLDVLNEDRRDPTRYVDAIKLASNVESLGGLSVLRAAAAAAGLAYYPEFNPDLQPKKKREDDELALAAALHGGGSDAAMIATMAKKVTISQVDQTGVAEVAVRAEDPVVAARAANAVGQAFIDQQILDKRQRRLKALDALLSQRRALLDRLGLIEQNIVAVRQGNRILFSDVGDERGGTFEDIRKSLISSEADLAQAAQKRRLLDQIRAAGGRLGDASSVTFSTLLESLRAKQAALEAELTEATGELGPRHPRVQQAAESLRKVQRAINAELDRIGESVRNEEQVLKSRVTILRERLAELETEFRGQTEGKVSLDRLSAEAEALRTSADKLDADLDIIKTSIGLEQSEAQFVSAAMVPERPVYPRRTLMAGAASVAWGGLMVLLVSATAIANPRLRRPTDMIAFEQAAGIHTMGVLPRVPGGLNPLLFEDDPLYERELKKIAAGIDVSAHAPRVFVVCSARAGDGGTTVAASLAALSARSGVPTIAVELDARGKLATLLNADLQAGLADCLRLGIDPLAAIAPSASERIHVLGHGSTRDGFLSLAGAALEQVYDKLKSTYKAVIILAPPLDHAWPRMNVPGDGLVIVARPDRSRAAQISRYVRSGSAIAANRAAVVLNLVDPDQCDDLRL